MTMENMPSFERADAFLLALYKAIEAAEMNLETSVDPQKGGSAITSFVVISRW